MIDVCKELLKGDTLIYLGLILIPLVASIALVVISSGETQIGKRKDGKYDYY